MSAAVLSNFVVAVVGGKIVEMGGHNGSTSLIEKCEMLCAASNTWIDLSDMKPQRAAMSQAVVLTQDNMHTILTSTGW